ncbi:Protein NUCLEAR FUSION DEFECTIVE 2 [Bienertia sinuspersici]
MDRRYAICFTVLMLMMVASSTGYQLGPQMTSDEYKKRFGASYSPFSAALETLQKQIDYTFNRIHLLRRAVTHASFSEENNRALSILGISIVETSVSFQYLQNDIDISSDTLNHEIQQVCNVESSCAVEGMRLGLHKVIRVSHNTNSTTPAIVCGAFRAIFGAIAIDSGKPDVAGKVFWNVHTRKGRLTAEL